MDTTEARKRLVVKDRLSGMTVSEIAEKYGRSDTTIKKYLREAGVTEEKEYTRKISRQRCEEARRLFAEGKTNKEIADEMGLSVSTVNTYIREQHLPDDPGQTYKESRAQQNGKSAIHRWAAYQIGSTFNTPEGPVKVTEVYPFFFAVEDKQGHKRTYTHQELYYGGLNDGNDRQRDSEEL